MDPLLLIAIWAALFVGSHLLISSNALRPVLVRTIGDQAYRGLYSVVALATFIPLVIAFAHHKHIGPLVWYLRDIPPLRWLAWLLMFAAFIFFVGSFINPNPGAIGAPSGGGARGILKITRHPNFVAIALFAIAHMLMNGWAGDLIFFGSFGVLAIAGGHHQDVRKLRDLGAPYRALLEQTSFFPGAALFSRRQRWAAGDTPWYAMVIGAAVTVVVLIFHPRLFGGSPLG
jgi:uncharacterized membrane protein